MSAITSGRLPMQRKRQPAVEITGVSGVVGPANVVGGGEEGPPVPPVDAERVAFGAGCVLPQSPALFVKQVDFTVEFTTRIQCERLGSYERVTRSPKPRKDTFCRQAKHTEQVRVSELLVCPGEHERVYCWSCALYHALYPQLSKLSVCHSIVRAVCR